MAYTSEELAFITNQLLSSTDPRTNALVKELEGFEGKVSREDFEATLRAAIAKGSKEGADPAVLDKALAEQKDKQKNTVIETISDTIGSLIGRVNGMFGIAWDFAKNVVPGITTALSGLADQAIAMFSNEDEGTKAANRQIAGATLEAANVNFVNGTEVLKLKNPRLVAKLITEARTNGLLPQNWEQLNTERKTDEEKAVLSKTELAKLDRNGDQQLTKDEIPPALRAQFDELLKTQATKQNPNPQEFSLVDGAFQPVNLPKLVQTTVASK